MYLPSVVVLSVWVLCVGCGGPARVVYPESKITSIPYPAPNPDGNMKRQYLKAINSARAKPRTCGDRSYGPADRLVWSEALYRAAYEHSQDMAKSARFGHQGSGGSSDWSADKQHLQSSSFVDRIENNGYIRRLSIAENIAYGAKSTDEVMAQWLASKGHCINIMNPLFTEVGMARVKDTSGRYYWTQVFASQHP
jgi:uncharacterized protein YkwD